MVKDMNEAEVCMQENSLTDLGSARNMVLPAAAKQTEQRYNNHLTVR